MRYKDSVESESAIVVPSAQPLVPERLAIALAYIACGLIWGTTWFAIRVCVGPGGYPPFMAGALRFSLATVVLGLIWVARPFKIGEFTPRNLIWIAITCLSSSAGFAMVYTAEKWISGGLAAIISSTAPLMMAVVATVSGTEKVSRSSLLGSFVALGGVMAIFQDSLHASSEQALGVGLLLVSVVVSQVNSALLRQHTQGLNPFVTTTLFSIVSGLTFWIASIAVEQRGLPVPPPLLPSFACAYLGIFGSVVAFLCYFYLLKKVRLMTLTTLVFYPPLIALGVDALWEKGFVAGPATYSGMAITLVGVAICLFGSRTSLEH
jgi:drug/metabolite transporter (DMT)-like permease